MGTVILEIYQSITSKQTITLQGMSCEFVNNLILQFAKKGYNIKVTQ